MIRKLTIGICLTLFTCYVNAQQTKHKYWVFSYFKDNGQDGLHLAYSEDAYNWKALNDDKSFLKPTAGQDKLMRDPCVIRGADGKFHMVWTVSWGERTIGYASSDDLINWSPQQEIHVMETEARTLNAWAPEIFYDVKSKNYMIYWASTIPGKFPKTGQDEKDKYNHRMYYVLTKDFKTFTKAKLMYDKGFSVIDGTILKNGKDYVMFLKNENDAPAEKNLRIATSKSLYENYTQPSAPITGKYWAEGPTVLKTGKQWLVYFDKYMEHKYGAVVSEDLKNWTDISEQISVPNGLRHGTILEITKQELDKLKAFDAQKSSAAAIKNQYKAEGYNLVWSDEFENTGAPDPANWRYEKGFVRNEELQWYQPENARCENGMLIIEARKEQRPNPNYIEGSKDWRKKRAQIEYTSACVLTEGLQSWQYGRFEMRGRINISSGLWPAFWTLGQKGGWPANGEIDIMEYYKGGLLANIASMGNNRKPKWYSTTKPVSQLGAKEWASKFHVWRMDWDATAISLYVDDMLLNKVSLSKLQNEDGSNVNPFMQKHYLLLNLAMGGMNGGDLGDTPFPNRMEVDYVRVYQRNNME